MIVKERNVENHVAHTVYVMAMAFVQVLSLIHAQYMDVVERIAETTAYREI